MNIRKRIEDVWEWALPSSLCTCRPFTWSEPVRWLVGLLFGVLIFAVGAAIMLTPVAVAYVFVTGLQEVFGGGTGLWACLYLPVLVAVVIIGVRALNGHL